MNEQEALAKMVSPGSPRQGKWRNGVIQIWVTRTCDKSCFNCTQGSNYKPQKTSYERFITLPQFQQACSSLKGYYGVIGIFGGNPATHPQFEDLCQILSDVIPYEKRGLWCNNPINESKAKAMRKTFNPRVSNLNVHMDPLAYEKFKSWWPECMPFGLHQDSRHSPVYVSPKDLGIPENERWELISNCDINQHWSAMIGVFRNQLRGYFCEVAGAMSMLKQVDPSWPDTGVSVTPDWWNKPIQDFAEQVKQHCHNCGVPLRGYGELAQAEEGIETISEYWKKEAQPKNSKRPLEVVTTTEELRSQKLEITTHYLQNANV